MHEATYGDESLTEHSLGDIKVNKLSYQLLQLSNKLQSYNNATEHCDKEAMGKAIADNLPSILKELNSLGEKLK